MQSCLNIHQIEGKHIITKLRNKKKTIYESYKDAKQNLLKIKRNNKW